jgi:Na+/H+ antiporter NhaD/arsenite permease-like protein
LTTLLAHPAGEKLLAAISLGAVFMGANTYLGNGPNLMVQAVAQVRLLTCCS